MAHRKYWWVLMYLGGRELPKETAGPFNTRGQALKRAKEAWREYEMSVSAGDHIKVAQDPVGRSSDDEREVFSIPRYCKVRDEMGEGARMGAPNGGHKKRTTKKRTTKKRTTKKRVKKSEVEKGFDKLKHRLGRLIGK